MDQRTIDDTREVQAKIDHAAATGGEVVLDDNREYWIYGCYITPGIAQSIDFRGRPIIRRPDDSLFRAFTRQSGRTAKILQADGTVQTVDVPFDAENLPDVSWHGYRFDGGVRHISTIDAINAWYVEQTGQKWNAIDDAIWDDSSQAPEPDPTKIIPPMRYFDCEFRRLNTGAKFDAVDYGVIQDCYFEELTGHGFSAKSFTQRNLWPNHKQVVIEAFSNKTVNCSSAFDFSSLASSDNAEEKPERHDVAIVYGHVDIDGYLGAKVHGSSWFSRIEDYRFSRPSGWKIDNSAAFRCLSQSGWGGSMKNCYAENIWRAVNLRTADADWQTHGHTNKTFCHGTNQTNLSVFAQEHLGVYTDPRFNGWQSRSPIYEESSGDYSHDPQTWATLIDQMNELARAECDRHAGSGIKKWFIGEKDWLPKAVRELVTTDYGV